MSQKRLHSRRGEVVARRRGEQPVPTAGWDGQVPSGGGRAGFSTLCGSAPRDGPAAALRHARLTGTEIRVEGWTVVAWVAPRACGGRLRRAGRRDPVAAWGAGRIRGRVEMPRTGGRFGPQAPLGCDSQARISTAALSSAAFAGAAVRLAPLLAASPLR
jgi:hypothetical protein